MDHKERNKDKKVDYSRNESNRQRPECYGIEELHLAKKDGGQLWSAEVEAVTVAPTNAYEVSRHSSTISVES